MSIEPQHNNPITLTRHLLRESKRHGSSGDFPMLIQCIQLAVKVIASATNKAGISKLYGVAGTTNISGDEQKALDILSNDVFKNSLLFSDQVYIMGSEEEEEPIIVNDAKGGYALVFDPLDGSSNIDANVSIGSIFGIYQKEQISGTRTSVNDLLKPGNKLIAAGYALYGPSTSLVLATHTGVNGFTLDPSIGEFILTHKKMKIPSHAKIYSINEGNRSAWDKPTIEYIDHCIARNYRARYIGSMVSDVHRTLLYGGIFGYPADAKNRQGKLRYLYEVAPMAYIIEKAGGRCTTGISPILDIQPTTLHERCPIWLGSPTMIDEVEEYYTKYKDTEHVYAPQKKISPLPTATTTATTAASTAAVSLPSLSLSSTSISSSVSALPSTPSISSASASFVKSKL